MTYAIAKYERDTIAKAHHEACVALQKARGDAPANAFGLTPDHVKSSPEYQAAWNNERRLFSLLRAANSNINANYAAEYRAEREARRATKTA